MKMSANTYKQRRALTYPYLLLDTLTETAALLIGCLPEGTLPLNYYKGDTLVMLKSVSCHPKHIKLLVELFTPKIVFSKTESTQLKSVYDYIKEGVKINE